MLWRLPRARTPVLFAYYAALNLLGANALFSKLQVSQMLDPAIKSKKSAVEKHHLFPRAYLKSLGITEVRQVNQIANFALVEWSDNIAIKDKAPAEYFPKYRALYESNPAELELLMQWHALPDGWEKMEYHEFLGRRRVLIAGVIRKGVEKLFG